MDKLRFYVLLNSILVIRMMVGDNERLFAMKLCLKLKDSASSGSPTQGSYPNVLKYWDT